MIFKKTIIYTELKKNIFFKLLFQDSTEQKMYADISMKLIQKVHV